MKTNGNSASVELNVWHLMYMYFIILHAKLNMCYVCSFIYAGSDGKSPIKPCPHCRRKVRLSHKSF